MFEVSNDTRAMMATKIYQGLRQSPGWNQLNPTRDETMEEAVRQAANLIAWLDFQAGHGPIPVVCKLRLENVELIRSHAAAKNLTEDDAFNELLGRGLEKLDRLKAEDPEKLERLLSEYHASKK